MKITIITIGSQGDVQPFIALGKALKSSRHQVKIATHTPFQQIIAEQGLDFHPVQGDPKAILESENGAKVMASGRNPVKFINAFREAAQEAMLPGFDDCLNASLDADVIACPYFVAISVGYNISEALNIPCWLTYLQPVTPTKKFPLLMAPAWFHLQGWGNYMTYKMGEQFLWLTFRQIINTWRTKKLGLKPTPFTGPFEQLNSPKYPLTYGFSPSLIPEPSDWPDWVKTSGFWFLDHDPSWKPPEKLVDFLQSGEAPVYIGFGSMNNKNSLELAEMIIKTLSSTRQRGILATGWGGIDPDHLPEHVCQIGQIPHDWLFPKMKMVVHHGGAGTTAAGLRAGIPNVIIPFFGDQPYWGQLIYKHKLGPMPIPKNSLNHHSLANAILTSTQNPDIIERAKAIGVKIQTENGLKKAVDQFNQYFNSV